MVSKTIYLAFYTYTGAKEDSHYLDPIVQMFLNLWELTIFERDAFYHVSLLYKENGIFYCWHAKKDVGVYCHAEDEGSSDSLYKNPDCIKFKAVDLSTHNYEKCKEFLETQRMKPYNDSVLCYWFCGGIMTRIMNFCYYGKCIKKHKNTWSCSSLVCQALLDMGCMEQSGVKLPEDPDKCSPDKLYQFLEHVRIPLDNELSFIKNKFKRK